jgi:tetratricopeptide (TPR) repeat protein
MDLLSNERLPSQEGSVEPPDGGSTELSASAAGSATQGADICAEAPGQADDRTETEEDTTECNSAAEEQLIKNWPVLDGRDGGTTRHPRRWPLLAVALIFVAAGGSYAMHIGPRSRRLASSRSVAQAAKAPASRVPAMMAEGQGIGVQAAAPAVDHPAEVQPGAVPVSTQASDEASAQVEAETAEQAPGAATAGTEALAERCREANAGGRGRPSAVLAACRPAIEAEPQAADILAMLARAEIDLGRAAEARNWARRALRVDRNLADAYVFLGGAEQAMGRHVEAKAAYKKYLELAPTGRHAGELRAILGDL